MLLAGCQPPLNIFCSILSTVGALCENDFTQVFWYFYCSGQRVWPNPDTFHPGSLDDSPRGDQFLYEWYSKQPKALDEPSLWTLSKTQKEQSYRFLWLRTFHHPAAVRIDVNGTSRLTTKIASGAGGYAPGHFGAERHLRTDEGADRLVFGKKSTKTSSGNRHRWTSRD